MSSLAGITGSRGVNRVPGDDAQRRATGNEFGTERMQMTSGFKPIEEEAPETVQRKATPTGGTTASGRSVATGLRSFFTFTSR